MKLWQSRKAMQTETPTESSPAPQHKQSRFSHLGIRWRLVGSFAMFVALLLMLLWLLQIVFLESFYKTIKTNSIKNTAEQIAAGATYLDVNIGPAEKDGPERMMWAVKLLQENFNNVPLALDTANKRAIEAGIKVYNRTNGKPIVNSADAGSRISNIDLAAANDAICIALCSADGIAKDNEERMKHCHNMLERGMSLGMDATDLWFDPLFLVVKGMQDKQMEVLEAIKMFASEGLKSTGGLSNNSNGAPKTLRPIMDSALVAMAMMQGLTSAIVNPCDLRLMETIKSCDIFKNHVLYSDSYLDL